MQPKVDWAAFLCKKMREIIDKCKKYGIVIKCMYNYNDKSIGSYLWLQVKKRKKD